MNQNDMMREALRVAYHAGNLSGHDNTVESRWSADVDDEAYEFADAYIAQQTLAATPEPAPMVRLTRYDSAALALACTDRATGELDAEKFANAIMDAMIAKNGGNV